jgi:hypothetical protein
MICKFTVFRSKGVPQLNMCIIRTELYVMRAQVGGVVFWGSGAIPVIPENSPLLNIRKNNRQVYVYVNLSLQ